LTNLLFGSFKEFWPSFGERNYDIAEGIKMLTNAILLPEIPQLQL